MFMANNIQ
jgi:obg-like ATPase 1